MKYILSLLVLSIFLITGSQTASAMVIKKKLRVSGQAQPTVIQDIQKLIDTTKPPQVQKKPVVIIKKSVKKSVTIIKKPIKKPVVIVKKNMKPKLKPVSSTSTGSVQ